MLRPLRSIVLILLIVPCLGGLALATGSATLTITGNEQQSPTTGVWDSGTVTITVNGHSETIAYGQFSTPASIASGLAAKLSSDCAGTVNARATGAVITFNLRHTASTLGDVTISSTHDTTDFSAPSFAVDSTGWPQSPTPVITGVSPSSGRLGAVVTVSGYNFGAGQGTITVAGVAVPLIQPWSDTSIVFYVPLGAKSGPIQITTSAGKSSQSGTFTFLGSLCGN